MKSFTQAAATLLLALAIPGIAQSADNGVVLIVNAANQSGLDQATIKRILLARTNRFPDGTEARVILRNNNFAGWKDCTSGFLEKSPDEVQRIWTSRVFSGATSPPQVLSGDAETIQTVASQRGAISCVSATSVAGMNANGVRVIKD